MKKYIQKIKQVIFWGGLEKEQYDLIKNDIGEKNRAYLKYFAIISTLVCGLLVFLTAIYVMMDINKEIYIRLLITSFILLAITLKAPQDSNLITSFLAYTFLAMLLGMGIATTLSDISQKTTIFLIFMCAIPLLFTLRPIHVIILEVVSEILYLVLITKYQIFYSVYPINAMNSIIIMIASLVIGVNVLNEKTISVYHANRNKYLLETDVLTGLLNRRSYEEQIEKITNGKKVFGVASFDVNGLKGANDNIGHHAGDELICGAGECIKASFGKYGKCFRTGGDEYVALLFQDFDENNLREDFKKVMAEWKGEWNSSIHISYGLVMVEETELDDIHEIVKKADSLMYKDKADYYTQNNIDRRRR